jgi:hypothetical protein
MAQINKPNLYFNTKTYTGTATSSGDTQAVTGVGFQPDWVWIKNRDGAYQHVLYDVIRGVNKEVRSSQNIAEVDSGTNGYLSAFDSDGFTTTRGTNTGNHVNVSGTGFVSWNWKAAGTAPTKTYTVKVVSDSGNKYRFDDFGTSAVTLELSEGGTYTFDQSDSSNSGHPLRFSTTSDGTHNSGTEYTTGVTTTGTPGSSGAKTVITVASSAPTLYYYCSAHSGMGGQANTPTTNSFSDFDGSIQSNVSPNTTAGFSIVSFTGTAANATVGHGLGVAPKVLLIKNRSATDDWAVYHGSLATDKYLRLNQNTAQETGTPMWNDTAPTSSVFSVGTYHNSNGPSENMIAYCFAEKKGYSKFGSYKGNGNADGAFIYTGFKPAFVMHKRTDTTEDWGITDVKRNTFNVVDKKLRPNANIAEVDQDILDINSNGFKWRTTSGEFNASGGTYIYMAFAEQPLVGTNNVPATAR